MSSASPTKSSSPSPRLTTKEGGTLLLDKPLQRQRLTEYHDTQHRSKYVTVHGVHLVYYPPCTQLFAWIRQIIHLSDLVCKDERVISS
jgi:hypothetical protein